MKLFLLIVGPVLVMFLIQLACCFIKDVVIKLMPLVVPAGFMIWFLISTNQVEQRAAEHYGCMIPFSIQGIILGFLGLLLAGIALGWMVYGVYSLILRLGK